MLVDSHAHLGMPQFNRDRYEVIRRAIDAGVELIFTVGTDMRGCRKAIEIARGNEQVFAIIGIHPHNAKDANEATFSDLRALSKYVKVKAIGEIGLDFFRNISPKEIQIARFRQQIHLARELGLPIVVHARDAQKEALTILREEGAQETGGVFHCFSGGYDMAKDCMDLDFFISIPGTITFNNSSELREVIKKIPLDRILLETDCPFLTPMPFRGKRNEPAYVRITALKLAEVRGLRFDEVARITSKNVKRVFRLDEELI
ncbi:MAG: TatD family hydrolase [Syntrophobacterales bacterium]|nr:MAG: TatD family hydrolase [Syntrophobacterales bacterium]